VATPRAVKTKIQIYILFKLQYSTYKLYRLYVNIIFIIPTNFLYNLYSLFTAFCYKNHEFYDPRRAARPSCDLALKYSALKLYSLYGIILFIIPTNSSTNNNLHHFSLFNINSSFFIKLSMPDMTALRAVKPILT
jgi:hypothetical protein